MPPSRPNMCCLAIISARPVDAVLEAKIANYLRRVQGAHGGWPLVHDGDFDMSASVKAYFALKMIGDSPDAPHMARAREAIRSRGGAIHSNVFTRFLLAMFGVLTWRSVPVLPVEIMLLPMWSPFHINKISYWARTTIVPLLVLAALKPRAQKSQGHRHRRAVSAGSAFDRNDAPRRRIKAGAGSSCSADWTAYCGWSSRCFRRSCVPARSKRRCFCRRTVERRRWSGRDFPPMVNAVMMYECWASRRIIRRARSTRTALDKLLGDRRARGLLPALRLAGVGHRADLPCADRGRRRAGGARRQAGAGLAEAEAGAGRQGRLGGEAAARFVPEAGRSSTTMPTIPISTTLRSW